jgi:hypothetical protein
MEDLPIECGLTIGKSYCKTELAAVKVARSDLLYVLAEALNGPGLDSIAAGSGTAPDFSVSARSVRPPLASASGDAPLPPPATRFLRYRHRARISPQKVMETLSR